MSHKTTAKIGFRSKWLNQGNLVTSEMSNASGLADAGLLAGFGQQSSAFFDSLQPLDSPPSGSA